MADLYKADGNIVNTLPANGEAFTMDELQQHVDGYVEIVGSAYSIALGCKLLVLGDEDGLPRQLPLNRNASLAAGKRLVGNVLFITEAEAAILLDTGDEVDDDDDEDEDDD